MQRKLYISNGKIADSGEGEAAVYVYSAPDEAERKYLIEQLKIDDHTLNSSLDPDELSRLEFEPEHIAMIFKRPKRYTAEDSFHFKVLSTGVFLFKDRLIIVLAEDVSLFEGRPFLKIQTIQDILLKLIYQAILHFVEHIRSITLISTELEQQINIAMGNKDLLNLFTLEKSLVYYLSAINSNNVLIEKIKNNASKIGLSPENLEFLDDIVIENSQCRGQAEIYSQVLASLMDARASIISNNLNVRIKTLTILTIAIMLPTLVVSIFSMNVRIPLSGFHNAFWVIVLLSAIPPIAVAILWRKMKW
ncbi:MAG: magnesium transporter CorA family protein [Sedimentisphaerales bacterium]|nr:magnesium transporter CorA family protein [Sedimentisphaerales bacterium]